MKMKLLNFKQKFFIGELFSHYIYPSTLNNCSVLMYHSICDNRNFSQKNIFQVSRKNFDLQMKLVSQINNLNKSNSTNTSSLTITFDDGYKDNLTIALPIIEKYNIPITIFVTASFIDKSNLYLSSKDLLFLANHELVTIGSHSFNHLSLDSVNIKSLNYEISESKKMIENITSHEVNSISFPNGSFNTNVLSVIKNHNYSNGYNSISTTFNNKKNFNKYSIPRITVWNYDTLTSFKDKINGKWNWCRFF